MGYDNACQTAAAQRIVDSLLPCHIEVALQRQPRLRAVERLDLALLVDAQDKRLVRRVVVDDSGPIRRVATQILEAVGLRASEAGSHADAVDQCARDMPDCILVDWMMPNDGPVTRFLSEIRRMPSGDRPKIIYLTSEYTETDFATARRHGADTLMMKPFDRELFLRPLVEAGIL